MSVDSQSGDCIRVEQLEVLANVFVVVLCLVALAIALGFAMKRSN